MKFHIILYCASLSVNLVLKNSKMEKTLSVHFLNGRVFFYEHYYLLVSKNLSATSGKTA